MIVSHIARRVYRTNPQLNETFSKLFISSKPVPDMFMNHKPKDKGESNHKKQRIESMTLWASSQVYQLVFHHVIRKNIDYHLSRQTTTGGSSQYHKQLPSILNKNTVLRLINFSINQILNILIDSLKRNQTKTLN